MRMETSKQPLRIENGRFMRGDVEVPAEIGNAEQIALLQSIERRADEAKTNGITCGFFTGNRYFDAVIRFKCVCGASIRRTIQCCDYEIEDSEKASAEAWDGETVCCGNCRCRYEIGNGIARLIK